MYLYLQVKLDCKKIKVFLFDNYIINNYCYGICVKKDNDIFIVSDDFEYGVELEMINNVFEENMYGDVGYFVVDIDQFQLKIMFSFVVYLYSIVLILSECQIGYENYNVVINIRRLKLSIK